MVISLTDYIS